MIKLRKINDQHFENGVRYVVADLIADSKPDTLPTTGSNIKGLNDGDYLDAGSTIITKNLDLAILGDSWGDWL